MQKKFALDIKDIRKHAPPNCTVFQGNCWKIPVSALDVIFISNLLEHLQHDKIEKTINACYNALNENGTLILLHPNFRFCKNHYFMFWDHITVLDDRAIKELIEDTGFNVILHKAKILPYTTYSNLPSSLFLLKLYLMFKLYRIYGAQFLIVAKKSKHKNLD